MTQTLFDRAKAKAPTTLEIEIPAWGETVTLRRLAPALRFRLNRSLEAYPRNDAGTFEDDAHALAWMAEAVAMSITEGDGTFRPFDSPEGHEFLRSSDHETINALTEAFNRLNPSPGAKKN